MNQSAEKTQLDDMLAELNSFVDKLKELKFRSIGSSIRVVAKTMQVQNNYIRSLERRIELLEALISHE